MPLAPGAPLTTKGQEEWDKLTPDQRDAVERFQAQARKQAVMELRNYLWHHNYDPESADNAQDWYQHSWLWGDLGSEKDQGNLFTDAYREQQRRLEELRKLLGEPGQEKQAPSPASPGAPATPPPSGTFDSTTPWGQGSASHSDPRIAGIAAQVFHQLHVQGADYKTGGQQFPTDQPEDRDLTAEDKAHVQTQQREAHWWQSLVEYRKNLSPAQSRLLDLWLKDHPNAKDDWIKNGRDEVPNTGNSLGESWSMDWHPGDRPAQPVDGTGFVTGLGLESKNPIIGVTQPLPARWQLGQWAQQRGDDNAWLPVHPPSWEAPDDPAANIQPAPPPPAGNGIRGPMRPSLT